MRAFSTIWALALAFNLNAICAAELTVRDGLALWLKGDAAAATLERLVWHDESGHQRDAVATTENAPTIVADGINGQAALRFDGLDDVVRIIDGNPFASGRPLTIFAVVKFDTLARPQGIIKAANDFEFTAQGEAELRFTRLGAGVSSREVMTACETHVVTVSADAAGTAIFIDGDRAGSGLALVGSEGTAGAISIGLGFAGAIAEILVFDASLSEADRDRVHTYLGLKYFPLRIMEPWPVAILWPQPAYARVMAEAGSAVFRYQWQGRNWTTGEYEDIPGATTERLLVSGNFEFEYVRAKIFALDELIRTTGPAHITTLGDVTPPFITAVERRLSNRNQIEVTFSAEIDPASLWQESMSVSGVRLTAVDFVAPSTVILTADAEILEESPYDIALGRIQDAFGNVSPNLQATLPPYRPRLIRAGRSTEAFTLSWLTLGRAYALESAASLGGNTWAAVANETHADGATNTVAICVGAENRFYRLRRIETNLENGLR